MRLLIVTTLYKRPELTGIILKYYHKLKLKHQDISLLACGSSEEDRLIASLNGWDYVSAPNAPLAQKHNRLFRAAREYIFDCIMLIGSDDLISEEIIEHYMNNYAWNYPSMVGFNMLHFYSVVEKKLIYFKGFPDDTTFRLTMGAGRLFSRSILEKMDFNLWNESKLNRGLDSVVSTYLKYNRIGEEEIKMSDIPDGMILDIKTDTNITEFKRVLVNCNECDVQLAFDKFPDEMKLICDIK